MDIPQKSTRILFYTSTNRAFRSTLIGNLYTISQKYPVVLLSEELDAETKQIISDKIWFPRLEKIIQVGQYESVGLLKKNRQLHILAKQVINQHKPSLVITPNDFSLFEMYLIRHAKKRGILTISLQPSLIWQPGLWTLLVDLENAYTRMPVFLPRSLRILFVRWRQYLGHLVYYWLLPLLVFEAPFRGRSSLVLRRGCSGMRDADYQAVFGKRDYKLHLQNGVVAHKLCILPHPLSQEVARNFMKKTLVGKILGVSRKKMALIIYPVEKIGFKSNDLSLISEAEMEKYRTEVIVFMARTLPKWDIFIKPHPDTKDPLKRTGELTNLPSNIKLVNPQENINTYVESSDIIMAFPPASTALFIASLQCPEKPILAIDFKEELTGDYYKNFEGIEYIESEEGFLDILTKIRAGKYTKTARQSKPEGFSNAVELIEYLMAKGKV